MKKSNFEKGVVFEIFEQGAMGIPGLLEVVKMNGESFKLDMNWKKVLLYFVN
jgi:hypothetical protein